MRPARRRRVHVAPDLTSLLDVLFVISFLALIRAAAAQQLAVAPAPPPPAIATPAVPADVALLRERALANVRADLDARTPVIVRVSAAGTVTALETAGIEKPLDIPLLELSADPDAGLAYLGDRSAELRVCRIAALQLGLPDLAEHLVIIAPAVPLADLRRALHRGLHDDLLRCLADQHGLATIVDPSTLPAPAPAPPPSTP